MKRCCLIICMIILTAGAGASLLAQGYHDRIGDTQHTDTLFKNREYLRQQAENKAQERLKENEAQQDSLWLRKQQEAQHWQEPHEKTKIRLTGSQLIIEDLPEDGVLEIYNIMGAKVYNRRMKAGTNQYILSLPKGYYIIKIGRITRKIALR